MARLGAHPTWQPLKLPPFSTWQAGPQHPAVNLPPSLSPAHLLRDPWPLYGSGGPSEGEDEAAVRCQCSHGSTLSGSLAALSW